MPTEARPLARQLLRVVLGTSDVSDRDLLARFVGTRDEDAFAEIVRRHGPMVLAACRRVTGRAHDAEDAFQAAFLVLARRAGDLTRPELLANWLYGVACRTALDARAARRRAEDRTVSAAPEPASPDAPDDTAELRRVIDEELAQLPDKYRSAVVLCDLEGLPRTAAAQQLGIPEGTLSSRLNHARKLLAGRLTRRGVTASAAALGAVFGRDSFATVLPHNLTHTTAQLAVRFAREGGTAPLGAPPEVSSLTEGALKAMFVTRLRQTFAVGLLACGLIGVGGALAQQLGVPVAQDLPPVAPALPLQPDTDPFIAQPQPKKAAEPKKVAAKGVEDDDVPYGSFPAQAVVRIEDGKLIVRQRAQSTESVVQRVGEATVMSYQTKSSVRATAHDPADLAVFDMKGNRLSPKAWKEMLKTDTHALIAHDGKLPNPRELTLFKQDTLLIVLPASVTPGSGYTTTSNGPTFYAPPAPPVVTTRPGSAVPPVAFPSQDVRPGPAPRATPAPKPTPQPAPENVRGTVLGALSPEGHVSLSIGIDAGLEVGSKLDVYRETDGGRYLGTLVVKSVKPKDAIAEFRPARRVPINKLQAEELPRKGDSVGQIVTPVRPAPLTVPQPVTNAETDPLVAPPTVPPEPVPSELPTLNPLQNR